MADIGLGSRDQRGQMPGRRGAIEAGRVDSGQVRELAGGRRFKIRRDREQVVEASRIQERDLGAALGGLAHTMGEHRRFAAQVASHHEQRVEFIDARNREPAETGRGRIVRLIAEVRLPQPMVDVARAQGAREFAAR